jgi:CCR4-NOT transcription complex subunit 4
LSGLRVVQKNLVYVVGLSPGIRENEILETLRGEKYFGQYGPILKIVVSKAKAGEVGPNSSSLGVYVTFAKKEDAARCIAAVNGSQNGDRVLRAQLGTTKYCSAYLRNEICTNKQCMFLHEPGDNDDSYSRQDLSSINSVNTQRPLTNVASSSGSSSRQVSRTQGPIQQSHPVSAASQPMAREDSKDASDNGDGSALPSSASWAKQRSRRGSHATSGDGSSPAMPQALPVSAESDPSVAPETSQDPATTQQEPEHDNSAPSPEVASNVLSRPAVDPVLLDLVKSINSPDLVFSGDEEQDYPPLFDMYGGKKRRALKQQEEDRQQMDQESETDQNSVTDPIEDEEPDSGISGSLQLGGEPEDGGREVPHNFQRRQSAQHPIQRGSSGLFGPSLAQSFPQNLGNLSSINGRALTPLQQSQILLMKSGAPQSTFMDQYPPGMGNSLGQSFQQPGHNRQSSRYNFAGEGSTASTSVKPSANPKFLAQQSSMMPSSHQNAQFYGSSMPGPPPGLKSSGTPPINGMFGQGFGSSMSGNALFNTKENNNDMLRDVMRGRGVTGGSIDKREYFPSFLQQYPSASSTPAPASNLLASLYGPQTGAFHDYGQKQKKKGKKHRHANTSSSGGGGLVDLADPSILQARMHQQQSNAGVGQGLYGGQTPGGYNQSMMYGGAGYGRGW